MGEEGTRGDSPPANRRFTVEQAADQLGITEAAVRGRIKRGTLRSYRESGRVYVLLQGDASATNRSEPTDKPTDQSGVEDDNNINTPNFFDNRQEVDPRDELIEELRDRVRALEEANRETRRLLAGALERIPAIESPEATESSETSAPPQSHTDTSEQEREPETAPQRRGWFRRFFGIE